MSSVRLIVIMAAVVMALGVAAGCSAATAPAASTASPSTAAPSTAPTRAAPASDAEHAHPSTPSAAADPVIVDCTRTGQVRPGEYVITCADANDQLTDLHWTSWGPQTATGVGRQVVNDCIPSCVAGHDHTYPVRVTLSDPTAWSGHKTLRFATMTIDYPGPRPAQTPAVVAVQLPG